jgi:hypothetical protein
MSDKYSHPVTKIRIELGITNRIPSAWLGLSSERELAYPESIPKTKTNMCERKQTMVHRRPIFLLTLCPGMPFV